MVGLGGIDKVSAEDYTQVPKCKTSLNNNIGFRCVVMKQGHWN